MARFGVTFIPAPGLEHELRFSTDVAVAVHTKGQEVAERARAIAPVRTGFYRDSIVAEATVDAESVVTQIVAGAPYSVYIEFGTSDTPTFATLRRALLGRAGLSPRALRSSITQRRVNINR